MSNDKLAQALRMQHEDRLRHSIQRRKSLVTGGKGSTGMFGDLLESAYLESGMGKLTVEALAAHEAEKQAGPVALGYMNAGHVHEMQQGRLPYGYVYPEEATGAHVPIYLAPPSPLTEQAGPVAVKAPAPAHAWDRDAAIKQIAAERGALLQAKYASGWTSEQEARFEALNSDMNALSPRVTDEMVKRLEAIAERLSPSPAVGADATPVLRRLVEQIDKAEFVEENGHRLKMNTAYIAAKELL